MADYEKNETVDTSLDTEEESSGLIDKTAALIAGGIAGGVIIGQFIGDKVGNPLKVAGGMKEKIQLNLRKQKQKKFAKRQEKILKEQEKLNVDIAKEATPEPEKVEETENK